MSKSMSKTAINTGRRALNRLIVACLNEIAALNAAVNVIHRGPGASRLQRQSHRRGVFRQDLVAGVVALRGVPARKTSMLANLRSSMRDLKGLLSGPHEGDAYEACARTTARSARAYSAALALDLPSDMRFGVERQYAEIESDREELRRMRWGAKPSAFPGRSVENDTESDRLALASWRDDGGRGERGGGEQTKRAYPSTKGAPLANR